MSDDMTTVDPTAGYGRPEWEPLDGGAIADRTGPVLLIGTRKGLWIAAADGARQRWAMAGPMFLGHIIQHAVLDPRDRTTLLVANKTGHLGPTIFRSSDLGRTWKEAATPPAFPAEDVHGRTLSGTFWLTPGHATEPDSWYLGGLPQGLFRSDDGGDSWLPVAGWNDHPNFADWAEWPEQGTPDGSMLHSINIDPRDPAHLYIGLSGGGVFESTDGGHDWAPLNAGCAADFLPDPDVSLRT